MDAKAFFHKCIQLPAEFDEKSAALLAAEEAQIAKSDETELEVLAIQKLLKSLELVTNQDNALYAIKTLFYVAEYAVFTQKPRMAISWCYVVMNYPATSDEYRERVEKLLLEIKLKLPKDIYEASIEGTTLNLHLALNNAREWLEGQQRSAAQPSTKVLFNSGYINKRQSSKK